MVRTQISFEEEQMHRLRQAARRRGVSIAAIVRAAVDRELGQEATARQARMRRALEAMDRAFRSGHSDTSRRHDDYLTEIYAE